MVSALCMNPYHLHDPGAQCSPAFAAFAIHLPGPLRRSLWRAMDQSIQRQLNMQHYQLKPQLRPFSDSPFPSVLQETQISPAGDVTAAAALTGQMPMVASRKQDVAFGL
ncbi:hypothetical protein VTG60DRAFT_2010 [Thermothelomyces hinnuleus]